MEAIKLEDAIKAVQGTVISGETGDKEYDTFKPTLVKTGIKSYFNEDEALFLANRSSHPGKKGLILANSICSHKR